MENNQNTEEIIYAQNPKLDFLFGMYGGNPTPTKQDKFVPANVTQVNDDGSEEILKNFYTKKPDGDAVTEFTNELRRIASEIFIDGKRIEKPNLVEVLLSFSITEKRFKEVDLDNLTKCVLDALNTIAFEDDSQVSSLIINKHIHEMKINALLIGIVKLTADKKGFHDEIKLFGIKK